MEVHTSVVACSLDSAAWTLYLSQININISANTLCEVTKDLSVSSFDAEAITSLLTKHPDLKIIFFYWPIEIQSFESEQEILANLDSWIEQVSNYAEFKRKFRNRVSIFHGLHLYSSFFNQEVPKGLVNQNVDFSCESCIEMLCRQSWLQKYDDYNEANATMHALEQNPSHFESRAKALNLKMTEITEKLAAYCRYEEENCRQQEKIQSLERVVSEAKEELTLMQSERNSLKDQTFLLQSALEKKVEEYSEHSKEQIEEIRTLEKNAEQRFNLSLKELSQLNNTLAAKETELEKEIKQKQNVEKRLAAFEIDLAKALARNDNLSKDLSAEKKRLQVVIASLKEQVVSLNQECQNLSNECVLEKREADTIKRSLEVESNSNNQLQRQLVEVQLYVEKQHEANENQVNQLETQFKVQLDNLEKDLSCERDSNQQLSQQVDLLKTQLTEQASALNKKILTERMQKDRLEQKLNSKLNRTNAKFNSAGAKASLLEHEISEIKKSKYWKLLNPARKLKEIITSSGKDIDSDIALLYTSDIFDANWYLDTYADVAELGTDPAKHYLVHGFKEGRRPSSYFDGDWYLMHYKDVAEKGMNPLLHYLKYGQAEGRKASPRLLNVK